MKTIETEKQLKIIVEDHGTVQNCTFVQHVPKQICFDCKVLYEAYLADDELWGLLPEYLQGKFLCPHCFTRRLP